MKSIETFKGLSLNIFSEKNINNGFPRADASFLCTALGGDIITKTLRACVGCRSEFVIASPKNFSKDFAYRLLVLNNRFPECRYVIALNRTVLWTPSSTLGLLLSGRYRNNSANKVSSVSQGRFHDFFQGVAEISSGGGENLPGALFGST